MDKIEAIGAFTHQLHMQQQRDAYAAEIAANSRRYLTFISIDWEADNGDIVDLIDSLPEAPTKEQFDACFDAIAERRKAAQ